MLELNGISKSFRNQNSETRALNKVTMSFDRQVSCVVGPNGAGKTTLFNVIFGMFRDFGGEMCLGDSKFSKTMVSDWRKRICYLPEENHLYEFMTVSEYVFLVGGLVGLGRRDIVERLSWLTEGLYLGEFLDKEIYRLSAGMKKKCQIAAALLVKKDVLLFDEPFNNLDPESVFWLKSYLRATASEAIVIYSSHTLDIVRSLSDRVYFLIEGSVAASINQRDEQLDIEAAYMRLLQDHAK